MRTSTIILWFIVALIGIAIVFGVVAFKQWPSINSAPQVAVVEISTQPSILLNNPPYPYDRLTLDGFAIGDPETKCTATEIADKSDDGSIRIADDCVVVIKDGKVFELDIHDPQILNRIGLSSREDMIRRFGPPPFTKSSYFGYPSLGIGFGWEMADTPQPDGTFSYVLAGVYIHQPDDQ